MGSLNGTKILVGKENQGTRLQIAVFKNNKRAYVNVPTFQEVPGCVSRLMLNDSSPKAHCMISIDAQGGMTITNLKIQNRTYVDGLECDQKCITPASRISLGMEKYPLDLGSILSSAEILADKIDVASGGGKRGSAGGAQTPPKPKPEVSIAHLEGIYDRYEADMAAVRARSRRVNILASSTGVFTMSSMALGLLMGREDESTRNILFILSGLALVVTIVSLFLKIKDNSEEKIKEINDRFMHEYNCPHCGRFLGNQKFFLVQQAGGHSCGCRFR